MIPLQMIGCHNTNESIIAANLEATMWRGYRTFSADVASGPITIVGAGPSLASTYRRINGDIIACNSAHDFLIEHGIVPKYAMMWDANPVMEKMVRPHPGVKYLIASRCHESVFRKFVGHDVTVWHAMGDTQLNLILGRYKKHELIVNGGTTSATRAMFLAMAMGYKGPMSLHGVDGSYADDGETHVSGSVVAQAKMQISVCGQKFIVAPWMALQGEDFKKVIPLLKEMGAVMTFHGTGLVPYIASHLGCSTPDFKVGWLEKHVQRPYGSLKSLYTMLRKSPQLLGALNHAGI